MTLLKQPFPPDKMTSNLASDGAYAFPCWQPPIDCIGINLTDFHQLTEVHS